MSGPNSQDVEMGEGNLESGKGDGNVHNNNATTTNNNTNNTNNNNVTREQTVPLPHTSLIFEVKQDLDETEQHQQQQQPVPPSSSPVSTSSKMKSSAASKKKGTAATKKGPKKSSAAAAAAAAAPSSSVTKGPRSRRGGRGGRRGGGGAAASSNRNRNKAGANGGGGGDNNSSDDDETDNGPYCLCRGPDDHRWMISCDVCEDWFHGECVRLEKETGERLVERFVCPGCTDGRRHYTKYKKTCALPGCGNAARLYGEDDRSVFCCGDHCDAWWAAMIATLPTGAAAAAAAAPREAMEVLTREDFAGLLASTAERGKGWKLGEKPFGNIEGLWSGGLPTRPDVLSDEEQAFLQGSAAERLALGNEIVQYKKMLQLLDWANQRRQAALEAGRFTKESCGYDGRLDTVSVRHQFAAWLETAEGQATFKSGRLDAPPPPASVSGTTDSADVHGQAQGDAVATRGMCEKKRCKPHAGWYKILTSAVRVLIKEAATAAAGKLEAEEVMRREAEVRYERRQLENNWVEVLEEVSD